MDQGNVVSGLLVPPPLRRLPLRPWERFLQKSFSGRRPVQQTAGSQACGTRRLHPSENINKYNKIIKKYKIIKIKLSKKKDLLDDIINNNFIVGCETTALVVALILKKKVFCSIPNGGKKSSLPYKKIMNISKLKNLYEA